MADITVGKENGQDIEIYYKDWGSGQPVQLKVYKGGAHGMCPTQTRSTRICWRLSRGEVWLEKFARLRPLDVDGKCKFHCCAVRSDVRKYQRIQ